jgi:hypothetical protein
MTYNVYQHWDPLKVCIVGRSYSPEFYQFIENTRVREVMERIARETEEDFQKLIGVLESFGVKVLRPNVSDDYTKYLINGKIKAPPMTPRDYSIMLGEHFYFQSHYVFLKLTESWNKVKGQDWPQDPPTTAEQIVNLPQFVKKEILEHVGIDIDAEACNTQQDLLSHLNEIDRFSWGEVLTEIAKTNQVITRVPSEYFTDINSAMSTRIGRDIYTGTQIYEQDITNTIKGRQKYYPQYRWHAIDTGGHADGTFCPVVPGLIVSLYDIPTYKDTFPGWEVIYLRGQGWDMVRPFLKLKEKNYGKWWVPGEELNDDFTEFVESWLGHWVGYVEETVFDVNMLVIDQKNVVCNNYNQAVFDAFERYGITPHVINFRHRFFWDGGLHCITTDIHREGIMNDYFPNRSNNE